LFCLYVMRTNDGADRCGGRSCLLLASFMRMRSGCWSDVDGEHAHIVAWSSVLLCLRKKQHRRRVFTFAGRALR